MDFEKDVLEMKNSAFSLREFSYPKVSKDDEKAISCLRERESFVGGYDVSLVYSESEYSTHIGHVFQVYASYGSFLPFSLVVKLARKFLGDEGLYYVSVLQNDRKIYIWTLCKDYKGNALEDVSYGSVKEDVYEGLKFNRVLSVDNSKFF